MISHYFKVGWRNLLRHKFISLLNVLALSLAISCGIVFVVFLDFQYSMDNFHINNRQTYLVTSVLNHNGDAQEWGTTPMPLADVLRSDFSQSIKNSIRVEVKSVDLHHDGNAFTEEVFFSDPEFLDIFTFPLMYGDTKYHGPNEVILSFKTSQKLFGDKNPVGESVDMSWRKNKQQLTIIGVFSEFHTNSSIQFAALIPYQNWLSMSGTLTSPDWATFTSATIIQLHEGISPKWHEGKLTHYVTVQNEINKTQPIRQLQFRRLRELSLNSAHIRDSISGGFGDESGRAAMLALGLCVLVLACFNYVNFSLATSYRRIKEIGMRKITGGSRSHLIIQFLCENLILSGIATALGMVAGILILLPEFNKIVSVDISISQINIVRLISYFISAVVMVGLLSGAYPAFYVSSVKPIVILTANQKLGARGYFSEALLFIQLVLSGIMITLSVLFLINQNFLEQKELGYAPENMMVLSARSSENITAIKNVIVNHTGVVSVASCREHIGFSWSKATAAMDDKIIHANLFNVDPKYPTVVGLKLKTGSFTPENTGNANYILINKTFARNAELENPVGKVVKIDSVAYTIAGVIDDFHSPGFNREVEPGVLRIEPNPRAHRTLVIKVRDGADQDVKAYVEDLWKRNYREEPLKLRNQTDAHYASLEFTQGQSKVMTTLGGVSIMLSVMGLFGILSLNISSTLKPLAIRKILGATLPDLFYKLNGRYFFIFALSLLLSIPASSYLASLVFETFYSYHLPLEFHYFLAGPMLNFTSMLMPMVLLIHDVRVISPLTAIRAN